MTITIYCSAECATKYYYNIDPNMIICKYTNRRSFRWVDTIVENTLLDQHSLFVWCVYNIGQYGIRTKERRHILYPRDVAKLKRSASFVLPY